MVVDSSVAPVKSVRNLGFCFHEHIAMDIHISGTSAVKVERTRVSDYDIKQLTYM